MNTTPEKKILSGNPPMSLTRTPAFKDTIPKGTQSRISGHVVLQAICITTAKPSNKKRKIIRRNQHLKIQWEAT